MTQRTKKILVTGVTGFIGSNLAKKLAADGHEVYGVTKPSVSRDISRFRDYFENVTIMTCDFTNYFGISNLMKEVDMDVVVHLGSYSHVSDSFEKPFSYVDANIKGTLNIAHAMASLPDFEERKLVYASSAEVYGIQEKKIPIKEDAALHPMSPYANTKAMTDMYLQMMIKVYGLNATILRSVNTYGRKFDNSFFVEYLISSMKDRKKIYIGAPDSVREYMYVDDHVTGYCKAMENFTKTGVYNVGSGKGYSNREVAEKLAALLGYDKKNIILGRYPPGYPLRPAHSDQPFILLDNGKIKRDFKWSPQISFDEGISRFLSE
jgi:nucleoside-diphosphate-sugar epimerase